MYGPDAGMRFGSAPDYGPKVLAGEIKGWLARQKGESTTAAKARAKKMEWWNPKLKFDSRTLRYWCWREPVDG